MKILYMEIMYLVHIYSPCPCSNLPQDCPSKLILLSGDVFNLFSYILGNTLELLLKKANMLCDLEQVKLNFSLYAKC